MGDGTSIGWTEATWNALRGCTRVSPGCVHCYAEGVAGRFSGPGQPYDGLAKMVTRPDGSKEARWTGAVRFIDAHILDPIRWRRPRMVFVNSMSDVFHEDVPDEWIDKHFAVMALSAHHTFQLLTKRPERMREYLKAQRVGHWSEQAKALGLPASALQSGSVLPNVWVGTSVENQETADERIPILLDTPAAVRWISAEPLLGPIDLTRLRTKAMGGSAQLSDALTGKQAYLHEGKVIPHPGHMASRLNWVVIGGESGHGARPFDLAWGRTIVEQCKAAGVAAFFKQVGAKPVNTRAPGNVAPFFPLGSKGEEWSNWPADLKVRDYPAEQNAAVSG